MDGGASSLKTPFPQDADERFSSSEEEGSSSSEEEEEDDDESDDEAELLREYEKIKREREEE